MLLSMSAAAPSVTLPLRTRWWRDLLFHAAGLVTAHVALVLWVTGVSVSVSLAITFFGLIVALGTLHACRWFARVERRRAGIVLGRPIAERYPPPPQDARWTARLHALIGDPTTWLDFTWTGLASVIAMTLSGLALTLWGIVLGLLTLPAWYWSLPEGANVGIADVDTLPAALAATVVGVALVPLVGWIVRGLTVVELAWMQALLSPRPEAAGDLAAAGVDRDADAPADALQAGAALLPPLPLHVSLSLLAGVVVFIIWLATGLGGYFWPVWVWFGLAITVALHVL